MFFPKSNSGDSFYLAGFDALLERVSDQPNMFPVSVLQLLYRAVEEGHTCVECVADDLPGHIVGRPGDFSPLVHDGERLYFACHWQDENAVAQSLQRLAEKHFDLPHQAERRLAATFPEGETGQKKAARKALGGGLTVIAGGPGTGKTTTVLRLLTVLLACHPEPLKIQLAAPTGKAAQRMSESIGRNKDRIDDLLVRAAIPESAQTLHRLLGYNPQTGLVRHDADFPLDLDLLVIDEASMIDLGLMSRLLAALPAHARLILLGDPDQLPSVDAGGVFADLCFLEEGAVAERIVRLQKSHRFDKDSGIGMLARQVNAGDVAGALHVLGEARHDLAWRQGWSEPELAAAITSGYAGYRDALRSRASVGKIFSAFNAFRLLCCRREGSAGVSRLNVLAQQTLFAGRGEWYAGRPVMVSCNDYDLRLFNGDIGIALPGPDGIRVWFEGEGGEFRAFPPDRLPRHETAFAMTVHKSQGSEFTSVLLVLPDEISQGVTRNLVYTAITRAREKAMIWGAQQVLAAALRERGERLSGLASKMHSLVVGQL